MSEQRSTSRLPMIKAPDPGELAREKEALAELSRKGSLARFGGYFRRTGPAWMQSAFTLGSGSAIASLYLGAHYGYRLLWVQPLAMIVGVIMLAAAANQTLCTGVRPFEAMRRFIHPALAWAWALATLVASIVFHLPQYALAAGVLEDLTLVTTGLEFEGSSRDLFLIAVGLVVLIVSTLITWNYGSGLRGIRLYERILKILVALIILAFAAVVVRSAVAGAIDWGELFSGFLPLYMPDDAVGVTKVMGAFGAAVGINMTFLFGYSLLARGWGREHRGLARFDLITGMLLPYTVAASLMVIAAACSIHGTEFGAADIHPRSAGLLIGAAGFGPDAARVIFGLGLLGMALSTITLQMLVVGFAACEMFGVDAGGWRYKLACLIPAPAFLGVILWKTLGTWIALPAFTFGLLMLPIAYIGWFALNQSTRYLGADKPTGGRRLGWNIAMLLALLVTIASVVYTLMKTSGPFMEWLGRIF